MSARRRKAFLEWMAWGTFYAFLFPFLTMMLLFGFRFTVAFTAALFSAFIGGPCMTFVFLAIVPYTRRFTFAVAILLQIGSMLIVVALGFYFSTVVIITLKNGVSILDSRAYTGAARALIFEEELRPAYAIAIGLMVLMSALGQISAKLGPGVLWSWITGKYHRPREERRIFMFLDIKDSTPLAEKLGNLKFSEMVQQFFRDLGDTISEFKGEVSHFIGDEAVIVWKPGKGIRNANCARFFFELRRAIADKSEEYRQRFGVAPSFKAGLHVGLVVAAEVTGGKSEIVYHGDAVNTTARIVGVCSEVGSDLLVSEELLREIGQLDCPERWVSVGEKALKGKSETFELFRPVESVWI